MSRAPDEGFVLINVLVVLALATTVLYAMMTLADLSIARSRGFSAAGQALALIRGGEQSAIAALRRDMIDAPESDHAAEPWAAAAQEAVAIAGGTFALLIEDAQGRYNLNNATGDAPQAEEALLRVVAAAGLPPGAAERIVASLSRDGPVGWIEEIGTRADLTPEETGRLGALATALPGQRTVNVNAAPAELLAVLIGDAVAARDLAQRRTDAGFVTPADIEASGVVLPPEVGFRSDLFRLRTTVGVDDALQSVESLLRRRDGPDGPEVVVVARRAAVAAPPPPP